MPERPDPDADARNALRLIGPDPRNWVADRTGIDHNVMIIGGGQSGCGFAFALRRAGIGKVSVIDMAADERRAGVWLNAARMTVLRTPKTLSGPENGIAALSFQAWHEARHGAAAYAAIERIARADWAEYLGWYRRFLGIAVRYRTCLMRVEPADGHFRLHLEAEGAVRVETARKVILANGVAGNGGAYIPPALAEGLPAQLYAHTADPIDFGTLRGKRVAVVGGAASAFDAAGVALEAGAASVDLFARRPALASLPVGRVRGYPGAYDNYPELSDRVRWHQAIRFRRAGSTPPADAIERVLRFPNFRLHLAAPWLAAREEDGQIAARAADGEFHFDFAIAGTGYFVDLGARPELAPFADRILLWRHRYTPPGDEEDQYLAAHPYLGEAHEYLEKIPG
ncbi:MAG: NAD(P)-binding domain-containing protein, partial [Stellaceae bacterium]